MMKQRQKNKYYNTPYKRLGLEKEKESDSESGEETELFVKNKPRKIEIPTIEKVIEDGDTLQSLAIRYHCTIAELKRLNNIDKENEIFAKRTIKVPYRPFSMALASVHISGRSSPNTSNESSVSNLIDIETMTSKLDDNLNLPNGKKNEVNEIIFNSHIVQKQCERVVEAAEETNICDEEIHLLPSRDREVPQADPVVSSLSCSGADGDISWIGLIVCIVLLIFALPLIYVFYIAEHIEKFQHHGS